MEGHKQQQKQYFEDFPDDWQPQKGEKIPSNHLSQYLDYFEYTDLQVFQRKRANLYSTLSNSLLFQITQDFQPTLSIKLLARSPNYEFVELQVAFGNFIFKNITLSNFNAESYTHNASCNYSGKFCMTYKVKCFGQELAFKCFHFPIQNEDSDKLKVLLGKVQAIREVIREYCLSLVASELQLGPKVERILGFDIAVYRNCAEFPMEFCGHKNQFPAKLDYQGQLKKDLSSAHLCKLIHYDIKPDNICYSWKKKKLVFIDFGFSEFSRVELGQLQTMKYRGSFTYVSKEMAEIFFSKVFGWVDPYYNDLHCVKKCVSEYLMINQDQILMSQSRINIYLPIEDLSLKYIIKKVKCLLYNGTKQNLQKVFRLKRYQETILQFKRDILDFDWKLRYPALFPQIIKILNRNDEYSEAIANTQNIFCPQPVQAGQQSSQNAAQDFYQKWFKFLQNNLLSFWRNHKEWQSSFSSQGQSLINIAQLHPAFRESYFIVLAEALQINTSKYTLSERIQMAKARLKLLGIQLKTKDNLSQLKRVSEELLQYSLSPPHKKNKLKIYEAILINVVVLKAVSQEALFSYYKRLLSFDVDAQTKLRMVLKFATTYQWMSFTIKSQQNHFKHIRKYRDFTLKYIEQLIKNGCKSQIIYFYRLLAQIYDIQIVIYNLQKRQNLQLSYSLNLRTLKDQKLKQMIADWKAFTHNYLSNVSYKDFTICQRQLLMKRHTMYLQIEYYHFGLFHNYLSSRNTNKMNSLRRLFLTIFGQLQIHNEYSVSSIPQILDKLQQLDENPQESTKSQLEQAKQYIQNRLPQSFFQDRVLFQHTVSRRFYNNLINNHQIGQFYLSLSLPNNFQTQLTSQEDFLANKQISLVKFIQNIDFMNTRRYRQPQGQQFKNHLVQKLKIRYKQQIEAFKKLKGKLNNYGKIVYLNICYQQLGLLLRFKNPQKNAQLHKIFIRTSYILRNSLLSPYHVVINFISAQCKMVPDEKIHHFNESIRLIFNFYHQFPRQRIFVYYPITFARLFLMVLHDYGIQKALQFYKALFEPVLSVIKVQKCFDYFRYLGKVILLNLSLLGEVQKQRVLKMMQKQLEKHPCLAIIGILILLTQSLKHRKLFLKLFKSLKHLHTPFRNIIKYYLFQRQIIQYLEQKVTLRRLMSIKRKYIKNCHDGQKKKDERPCKVNEWAWNPVLRYQKDSRKKMHISLFRQKISQIKLYGKSKLLDRLNRLDYC